MQEMYRSLIESANRLVRAVKENPVFRIEKKRMLAQRVLSDAKDPFYLNNGPEIRNLYELMSVMRSISDDQFSFHVNAEKNDFAQWLRHSVGDARLAEDVSALSSKHSMVLRIAERYLELSRHLGDRK